MVTDDPIIGNECWLYINADKTEITEGDSVQFTVHQHGACDSSSVVDIYINNSIVYTGQLSDSSLLYTHTFNESGEFTVYVDGEGFTNLSDSINITVEEAIIELPTSQVSWEINNKNVQSIEINNKEVKSIVTSSGQVLYSKEEDTEKVLELQFTGSNFSTYSNTPFTYTGDVFVDWGDNNELVKYTGGQLSHTYTSSNNYTIKIYGNITSLGDNCFNGLGNSNGLTSVIIPDSVTSFGFNCFRSSFDLASIIIPDSVTTIGTGCFASCTNLTSITMSNTITEFGNNLFLNCEKLTSIIIPDSITTLGLGCFTDCKSLTSITIPNNVIDIKNSCFSGCTNLTEIILEWNSSSKIISYNSSWINNCTSFDHFLIPEGTTQLYIDAGYPLNKLVEDIITINLIGNKSVLSYADNDTVTLSAEVLDWNNQPMQNITVNFYQKIGKGLFTRSHYMGSSNTNSNGIATYSYNSMGYGDVFFRAMIQNNQEEVIGQSTKYSVEDCWQVIPVGNRIGFNSNLAPTPLIITGTTKKEGSWGGTRFYGKDNGTTAINYVYLSQNSGNSSENEKIRYNLSTTAETFKITISDGTVELYINDVLQNSVNCNTTYPLQISGGSSANPVDITNIKIKADNSD